MPKKDEASLFFFTDYSPSWHRLIPSPLMQRTIAGDRQAILF